MWPAVGLAGTPVRRAHASHRDQGHWHSPVRLEIEDNIGFKWVLVVGKDVDPRYYREGFLLYHSHGVFCSYAGELTYDPEHNHLCLRFRDSEKPNQPLDQRVWTCGACSHEVPTEVVDYYNMVKWGLSTMMLEEETT
jgi:hypothetical protein